jgi:hypothetical protein
MTKPQRCAIACVPLISLGLLSWLPLLYLYLRAPRRALLFQAIGAFVATGAVIAEILFTRGDTLMSTVWSLMYVYLAALVTMVVWMETKPAAPAEQAAPDTTA